MTATRARPDPLLWSRCPALQDHIAMPKLNGYRALHPDGYRAQAGRWRSGPHRRCTRPDSGLSALVVQAGWKGRHRRALAACSPLREWTTRRTAQYKNRCSRPFRRDSTLHAEWRVSASFRLAPTTSVRRPHGGAQDRLRPSTADRPLPDALRAATSSRSCDEGRARRPATADSC